MSNDVDRARTRRARATTRKAQAAKAAKNMEKVVNASDALDNYDDIFLECRDLHHPWKRMGFFRVGAEIHRLLTCPRCTMEATDVWKPNGERVKRRYKPPAGYSIKGSNVTAFDVRREVLSRVTIYDNQAAMVESLFAPKKRKRSA